MQIRSFQPGDELAQARIYNIAAGSLPGFKPAKPEEITRRLHAGDTDPETTFYATEDGEIVGYAFSVPTVASVSPGPCRVRKWCKSRCSIRIVTEMNGEVSPTRGPPIARTGRPCSISCMDTTSPRFDPSSTTWPKRRVWPRLDQLPPTRLVTKLERDELPHLATLMPASFGKLDVHGIGQFFWENPFYSFPDHLVALKDAEKGISGGSRSWSSTTDLQTRPRSILPCLAFVWAHSVPNASVTNESTAFIPVSSWINTTVICCWRLQLQQYPVSPP